MEPTPALVAAYEAALPDDPRIERKKMFGMPCAFVNRQMFFGTFDDSVIARVGPERAEVLAATPGMRVFAPSEDRAWPDYIRVDTWQDTDLVRSLAREALLWTETLPPRSKKPGKRARG
jgi:TfoX/Sxy family transcriptional regulator of competence genes